MAAVNEDSTQVARVTGQPPNVNPVHEWGGRIRLAFFDYVRAVQGDAASLTSLVKLPAGKVRVLLAESRIAFSAQGAARTMDLGWLAHTNEDGTAVAADPNGLDDGVDVSSAGSVVPGGTVGGDETYLFDSREGVTLTAQINDGTTPAAGTLDGYFAYVVD